MLYDQIGHRYSNTRLPDPRIARGLHDTIRDCRSVVNVGAGVGAYEPADRCIVAIEPSITMIKQRRAGSAPAVQAVASALPLKDQCADATTAILTVHHWQLRSEALSELGRISRKRIVFLTWDPDHEGFWLTQQYLPSIAALDRKIFPAMSELARALGAIRTTVLPIPHDCLDGFLGAFWRRPEAYLDPAIRAGMSTFSRIDDEQVGLERLRKDLASGAWERRFGHVRTHSALDIGYRIVTVET